MRYLSPFWNGNKNVSRSLFSDFDDLFSNFYKNDFSVAEGFRAPATDIVENEKHYLISVDLPGLKQEDIQIEFDNQILSISGERKFQKKSEDNKVKTFEKSYGSFKRSFSVPASVDDSRIEAKFENGVLDLVLPKKAESLAKKIEIKSSN